MPNLQACKTTGVFLTPLILAPEQNIELAIRNYGNTGGLSISNATGWVHFPAGITTGLASIFENNPPTRNLLFTHDVGMHFRCATNYALSLTETGASVSGALSVNGNCNITGTLTVNGQSISQAQQSTVPVSISDVTGLTAALSGKQATLTSSSVVTLSELICTRVKPASGTLSFADSNNFERLGIAAGSVVCSAP